MTNKEKLADIQCLLNEFYSTDENRDGLPASAKKSKKLFNQYCRDIQKDLDFLELFLSCFEGAILEATSREYHRGYNILADLLKDELGLIKLYELKRRLGY